MKIYPKLVVILRNNQQGITKKIYFNRSLSLRNFAIDTSLEVNEAKHLEALESENTKLRNCQLKRCLEVEVSSDVVSKKW